MLRKTSVALLVAASGLAQWRAPAPTPAAAAPVAASPGASEGRSCAPPPHAFPGAGPCMHLQFEDGTLRDEIQEVLHVAYGVIPGVIVAVPLAER